MCHLSGAAHGHALHGSQPRDRLRAWSALWELQHQAGLAGEAPSRHRRLPRPRGLLRRAQYLDIIVTSQGCWPSEPPSGTSTGWGTDGAPPHSASVLFSRAVFSAEVCAHSQLAEGADSCSKVPENTGKHFLIFPPFSTRIRPA